MSGTEKAAVGLTALLALTGLYQGANVLTDHLNTADFPAHAKFHAALGGVLMLVVSALALAIASSPTWRRVGRGLLLTCLLLALPIGFLVAVAIVPAGSPGGSYIALAAVGAAGAVSTGVLMWQATRAGRRG